ncbi:swi snf family dna-dependent atpase [Colletotrichum plurivorum]|uniref:Swi snf family dna-dependent atpase n=1 Tax=Colletotrichum plurivorum TaxID=2175906 RepID=A0A8H6KJG8_9PEZI|nr:swi snf family dna-dependent atpase [Colletotrichum plurivorum]
MMAVTQSLSTLNQVFPSAWEREGIEAHQKLGAWLVGTPNGPPNQDGERRNCECGEDIDKRYFFTNCRHMSCEDCARQSGKCCNLTQSMILCYPPEREECSICEENNEVLIFSCGHTMCRLCWSRLLTINLGIYQLCPHCRMDISLGPIAKLR